MWALVWLLIVSTSQLLAVTCFALIPLKGQLDLLWTLQGWQQLYRFQLSNLDVFVLCWCKTALLASFILSAYSLSYVTAKQYSQARQRIGYTSTVLQTFLLIKLVAVAISAPDDVNPTPPSMPGQASFVGLALMFSSVCTAAVTSMIESLLAKVVVRRAEAAAAERRSSTACAHDPLHHTGDPLTAPLLGVTVDTTAASGTENTSEAAVASRSGGATKKKKEEEEEQNPKINSKTLTALLKLSAVEWPIITIAFTAGAVAAFAQALIPYWTGQVIDFASIEPNMSRFRVATLKLLASALVCAIFSGIRGGLFTVVGTKVNVRIRRLLFRNLLSFEIGFFDVTKSGDITSRLASDTTTASNQICLNTNVLLRSATQAAMVLAFMFFASWRLTVITFILVPLVLAISALYGNYFAKLSKKVQAELAEANAAAQEVLSSMTTVKAHGAQDSAEAMYGTKLHEFYKLNVKEAIAYATYACITTFLPNLVAAVVLYYGGQLVLSGQMSPGSLVSFMLYHQSLSGAFSSIGDVYSYLMASIGAAEKVMELINRKPEIDSGGSLIPLDGLNGKVELQSIVFSYPSRPSIRVLNGLSLIAAPGETVALVGVSGGGKSSIVKLLERFYLPQSGSVLIDGRDVGAYDAKWLRRQVALVSQEPLLYARSIKRNIVYGLEVEDGMPTAPTQEEVEEAASQANAHTFITSFPEGYDTDCGEKGVQMSGGQKQRIAIARALVRKPRILLLDEATSALDADSEAVVQDALDRMMSNRTTLVIAHRLSTIQGADRIIVIGKGVVQESGTHAELLEAGGAYALLVQRQLTRTPSSAVALKSLAANPSALSLPSLENSQS